MNILVICLIVTCCIVYIWDYVQFPQEITNIVAGWITKGKIKHAILRKPWGCSLCMSTWITLGILLCYQAWAYLPLCLVYGWSTQYILAIYDIIDGALTKVLGFIERITK